MVYFFFGIVSANICFFLNYSTNTSNVLQQFGRQIEAVIRDTLTHYGIENAEVTAVDKGALDCTVRARVTAAIFRSAQSDAYEWEVK